MINITHACCRVLCARFNSELTRIYLIISSDSGSYPLIYDQFNGFHQGTYLPHYGIFPQTAYGGPSHAHRNPNHAPNAGGPSQGGSAGGSPGGSSGGSPGESAGTANPDGANTPAVVRALLFQKMFTFLKF